MPLINPEIHRKLWGRELWIANSRLYCAKRLIINAGWQCSLHYHEIKDEIFTLVRGDVIIELGDQTIRLGVGDSVHVKPFVRHRFTSPYADSELFEVSTQHSDADVQRLEPSRRVK